MHFDLKRPCPKCPFRKDCILGWLGRIRSEDIAGAVLDDGKTFSCHETVEHDDETGEHVERDEEQHCVGALILTDNEEVSNQMQRIAGRLGIYDPENIDPKARDLIFESREDFVDHHEG